MTSAYTAKLAGENPEDGTQTPKPLLSHSSEDASLPAKPECASESSDESLIVDTRQTKQPPPQPVLAKKTSSGSKHNGTVPSFHIQKTLNVNSAFAKIMFDYVLRGDIAQVKKQEDRIGLDI